MLRSIAAPGLGLDPLKAEKVARWDKVPSVGMIHHAQSSMRLGADVAQNERRVLMSKRMMARVLWTYPSETVRSSRSYVCSSF